MTNKERIDLLSKEKKLSREEWINLIESYTREDREYASKLANAITVSHFGKKVYFRGIVEFTNICKNNCYYCGIRCENRNVSRYRLSKDEILECCDEGYEIGYRTFVLQGGEDPYYTDERLCDIVASIKAKYPDCAVTLSVGERDEESYRRLYKAGADRFLLRHEAACEEYYNRLHPSQMSWKRRMQCLRDLKKIGFQTGCGFMVGTPWQQAEHLAEDMLFISELQPEMVGIGPFIPHSETPFGEFAAGDTDLTLFLLSLCRIMLPKVLLPATTALGTVNDDGRALGVLAGCNVIMPNLSPMSVREKYLLYNNKAGIGESAKSGLEKLKAQMDKIGYAVEVGRGDHFDARKRGE